MTREEAINILRNATFSEGDERLTTAYLVVIEALEQEPIIHCKNCKHWQEWENGTGACRRSDIMWNDYCSFAERKESDNE